MLTKLFLAISFLCCSFTITAQQKRFSFSQPKMGSPFNIIFYYDDSLKANLLAKQCFSLVDSFVYIFSDYIDSSELMKLNGSAGFNPKPVILSPALFDILLLSKYAYEQSKGTCDITVGALVKLWRKARKTKQFPTDDEVQATLKLIGFNKLNIDTINKTVTLLSSGMQLDLGGIAQGYIAQKVLNFLTNQHINKALINVSGDIVMSDAPPNTTGWSVGINVPETKDELLPKTLIMHNKAVTTSGDAYQFMEHNGKKYSHIVNPKTGYGIISQKNVTVIANNGTMADWLTKACSILPIKKAKKLAKKLGAEVLITQIKNGRIRYHATKGFALYWKQVPL
ncbi:MAG: FAD:protein FMN transferase [Ferruginibacter sp.]|nr:FAD:protein FMN transferase [Ferruginibacter sp.]